MSNRLVTPCLHIFKNIRMHLLLNFKTKLMTTNIKYNTTIGYINNYINDNGQ